MDCRESEGFDDYEEGIFSCTKGNHPQQARAWPFLRRFGLWLPEGEWEKAREDDDIVKAVEKLKELDVIGLRSKLWVEKPDDDGKFDEKAEDIGRVLLAIKDLDTAILASKVLDKAYQGAIPDSTKFGNCVSVMNSLNHFNNFVEPAPSLEPAPEACKNLLAEKAREEGKGIL
eukprot:2941875-Amphidinium_carterae.1